MFDDGTTLDLLRCWHFLPFPVEGRLNMISDVVLPQLLLPEHKKLKYLVIISSVRSSSVYHGLITVVQNEVQVKQNISLAVYTSLETSVRYVSETVDEKIWRWDLSASW